MSDPEIRLILDTSAIVAYARDSVDVGEVLGEIAAEGATAGLPVLCLAEARRHVADPALIELLASHTATVILAPEPEAWRALAALSGIVGRLDAATALIDALDYDVEILTAQPGLYAGKPGRKRTIEIPED